MLLKRRQKKLRKNGRNQTPLPSSENRHPTTVDKRPRSLLRMSGYVQKSVQVQQECAEAERVRGLCSIGPSLAVDKVLFFDMSYLGLNADILLAPLAWRKVVKGMPTRTPVEFETLFVVSVHLSVELSRLNGVESAPDSSNLAKGLKADHKGEHACHRAHELQRLPVMFERQNGKNDGGGEADHHV